MLVGGRPLIEFVLAVRIADDWHEAARVKATCVSGALRQSERVLADRHRRLPLAIWAADPDVERARHAA